MFNKVGRWIARFLKSFCSPKPPYYCSHVYRVKPPVRIIILGRACELGELPCCPDCAEKYLNEFSVICAVCDTPIFPGTPIADSGQREKKYVHNTEECSLPGAYLGIWGEGKLTHFSELENI